MQFSKRSEYGIRMLTELAAHYGQGPRSLTDIARVEEMPIAFLEQIISSLRKSGFVCSYQGVRGGYELSRSPDQIHMNEVLGVLEGSLAPMLCAPLDGSTALCAREESCGSKFLWRRIRDAVSDALRTTTLADLVEAQRMKEPDLVPISSISRISRG